MLTLALAISASLATTAVSVPLDSALTAVITQTALTQAAAPAAPVESPTTPAAPEKNNVYDPYILLGALGLSVVFALTNLVRATR